MRKAATAMFVCSLMLSLMNVVVIRSSFAATTTPVVILTMDDGYDTVYNLTRPIMNTYGVYCTLGIITDYTTNGSEWEGCPVMTWAEVEAMEDDGHEIASHGSAHRKHLCNITAAELEDELKNSRDTIKANLGHYPDGILYPHGNYNATVVDEVEGYGYDYARTTETLALWTNNFWFNGSNLQTGDRMYEIPAHTSSIGGNTAYNNMKYRIDEAIAANAEYCGLILHRVCPDDFNVTGEDAHCGDFNVCNFTAFLEYAVNTKGLTVTSVKRALSMEFTQKALQIHMAELVGVVVMVSILSAIVGLNSRRRR